MSPATLIVLTVRLYASTAIAERDLNVARREARDILDRSGVTVAWIDCRAAQHSVACAAPLAAREVAVRFAPSVETRGSNLPLGESIVEGGDGGGTLATIYPARVAMLAANAHMPAGIVLGRAIVHEIGHLILGANAHRGNGVMRPVWTDTTVHLGATRDWQFAPDQSVALRARLSARTTAERGDTLEPARTSIANAQIRSSGFLWRSDCTAHGNGGIPCAMP